MTWKIAPLIQAWWWDDDCIRSSYSNFFIWKTLLAIHVWTLPECLSCHLKICRLGTWFFLCIWKMLSMGHEYQIPRFSLMLLLSLIDNISTTNIKHTPRIVIWIPIKHQKNVLSNLVFIEQNCGVLNLLTIANCTAYPRPRKVKHKSLACKCTNQFIINNYLHQLSVAIKI